MEVRLTAKLFHEKVACSFVTACLSEGTLLLHCIPAENYPDYPRDKENFRSVFHLEYPIAMNSLNAILYCVRRGKKIC